MMQVHDASKIKKTLSVERFESYRCSPNDPDEQVLACYLRNIQLSEALYPAFSILEVTLRNQLHHALCHKVQTQSWYTHQPEVLASAEQAEIQKAKDYLLQHGKPLEPGRIIAELNFGFWTRLFHPYYEQKLWPFLIPDVFPYAPRWTRERKKLLKRLNSFRLLRNRVSHHEPIWDWPNLPTLHQDMIETVGWMCPSTKHALASIDRFPTVF
jgi:Abi-like protein